MRTITFLNRRQMESAVMLAAAPDYPCPFCRWVRSLPDHILAGEFAAIEATRKVVIPDNVMFEEPKDQL